MNDPRGWHDFNYVHTDIPDGIRIAEWRTQRAAERIAARMSRARGTPMPAPALAGAVDPAVARADGSTARRRRRTDDPPPARRGRRRRAAGLHRGRR